MALKVSADNVEQTGPGVYALQMPPHRVRTFGLSAPAHGVRSILLLSGSEYSRGDRRLEFDLETAIALNVGTSSETIAIDASPSSSSLPSLQVGGKDRSSYEFGPGDQHFLKMANAELSEGMAAVARTLLEGVRNKSAGDLKKGLARNFSETPDNFWYVIIQPRIDQLSITVRGPVARFRDVTSLQVKDDRGNTLFKVCSPDDVEAALELIFLAVRKP
jgi:hypothetical protein